MNQNQQGLYNNPAAAGDIAVFSLYHNGVLENYIDPVNAKTVRPEGSLIPPPSDWRITMADNETLNDATPGFNMTGELPAIVTHEGNPNPTNDPRTTIGKQATTVLPQQLSAWDRATAFFSSSPIAALFLGLGGLLLFNQVALKNRGVGRGASRAGAGVAGAGGAVVGGATDTGKAAVDSVNDVLGGAVEAVEGVTS